MIRQHAVLFLRHPHIIGAQSRLDMSHRDMDFRCSQCARKRGIRIAVHQQEIRLFLKQDVLDFSEHFACLMAMRAGSYAKVIFGMRDAQFFKKYIRHIVVIVLAGMDDNLLHFSGKRGGNDGGLDELRPCPDNRNYFQGTDLPYRE